MTWIKQFVSEIKSYKLEHEVTDGSNCKNGRGEMTGGKVQDKNLANLPEEGNSIWSGDI